MDRLKGKYEVLFGFVTIAISLSAFKEELANINLDLGYTSISLAKYFLYTVYGLSICLYLYIIEYVARDSKIGTWKIFNFIIVLAYGLFSFILMTPILIIINIVIIKVYFLLPERTNEGYDTFLTYISVISILLSCVTVFTRSVESLRFRIRILKKATAEQEISEVEKANILFKEGYYFNSIIESLKVLETHLYKELIDINSRIPRQDLDDTINLAFKQGVISEEEYSKIINFKKMRNIALNSDEDLTKEHANSILDFVNELVECKN